MRSVGIGLSNPAYALQILGKLNLQGSAVIDSNLTVGGHLGIGLISPLVPLDVQGNTHLRGFATVDSDLTVTGNLFTSCISTACLHVSGKTTFDSLQVAKIRVSRITALPGDSLIHLGDSSIVIDGHRNSMYVSSAKASFPNPSNNFDLNIQNQLPPDPFPIGYTGNTIFNQYFGKVLIGGTPTSTDEKFQVNYGNILIKGPQNFMANGQQSYLYLGDTYNYISSTFGDGVRIGVFNAPDAVTIEQNGNMAIGTTPKSGIKLAVYGTIKSKEIIIDASNWSDFVFEKNYNRMHWKEKLLYLNNNHHLPFIASAKEIETSGIKTSETMKGIVQNIEENTLDIIDLQKLVEEQAKLIQKQKVEMEMLKKEVTELQGK